MIENKGINEIAIDSLRAKRLADGRTQVSVAAELGLGLSTIAGRETRKADLTVNEFVRWCHAVQLDPENVLRHAIAKRACNERIRRAQIKEVCAPVWDEIPF